MIAEYYNTFDFYNLSNFNPIDIDNIIQIDTENCNEIRIINTSISGVIAVNGVIIYALGSGKNQIIFRGNENEICTDKIFVNTIGIIGNINYSFAVIRKQFISNGRKFQNRFFDNHAKSGHPKRLR